MAKNVVIAGSTYNNVPSIEIPDSSGNVAKFVETSDATADSSKILKGYSAYANGSKINGSLKVASIQNGVVIWADSTINYGTSLPSSATEGQVFFLIE